MNNCEICGKETLNERYCSMKCMGKDPSRHKTAIENLPNEYWTNEEDELLRNNYGIIHISELEKLLGRNQGAIIQYAKRHGIRSARYWTEYQLDYLKEHYMDDYDDLCEHLNKSLSAVQHMTSRLKLKRNARWTKSRLETEFDSFLKELGIEYKYQVQAGRFVYDYLIGENILIEVQGNYWHCNPRFFPDGPTDDRQRDKVERDVIKAKTAYDLGYELVLFWEDDIYNKPQIVKELLRELPY